MSPERAYAEVDEGLCVGTGDCARIAPRAFHLDESAGVARVRDTVSETPVDDLLDAAANCPTQAIRVVQESDQDLA